VRAKVKEEEETNLTVTQTEKDMETFNGTIETLRKEVETFRKQFYRQDRGRRERQGGDRRSDRCPDTGRKGYRKTPFRPGPQTTGAKTSHGLRGEADRQGLRPGI